MQPLWLSESQSDKFIAAKKQSGRARKNAFPSYNCVLYAFYSLLVPDTRHVILMTLEHYSDEDLSNKYCKIKNLKNESNVEQNFLLPLIEELGYSEVFRESKEKIKELLVPYKRKKKHWS